MEMEDILPKRIQAESEADIMGEIRKFYKFEFRGCNALHSELDLSEKYAVTVGHPKIGDEAHKPKPCLCNPEDKEFAATIRKITDREELNVVIGEHLDLFKNYVKSNSDVLLLERISDVIQFCIRKNYDDCKLYCTVMINYRTHEFFVSSLKRSTMETYAFFREMILCHANEEPPFSYEVFSPEEVSELLLNFCKTYLRNLPLIRHICLPSFALRINSLDDVKDKSTREAPEDIHTAHSTPQQP